MSALKNLIVAFVLLQLFGACASESLLGASANTLQVAPQVTLAGQLSDKAPKILKRQNAVVIDLRGADEEVNIEAQQMKFHRVPYFNLPVSLESFNQTTVSDLAYILSEHSERPIIIHCQSGNRAALIWAALLKERGMSSVQAQSAVSPIVTKQPIRDAIEKYKSEGQQ